MKKNKTTENLKNENLALFGVEKIEISQEDLKKAKIENEKDKEALEIPTFISVDIKK